MCFQYNKQNIIVSLCWLGVSWYTNIDDNCDIVIFKYTQHKLLDAVHIYLGLTFKRCYMLVLVYL